MTRPRSSDVPPPLPEAVRLHVGAAGARPPRHVPFGLTAWTEANGAPDASILVALAPTEDLAALIAQVPPPATLRSGTRVYLPGEGSMSAGILGRLMPATAISRAARATALLALGYTAIGAGTHGALDLVWGVA